jgi:hypothetical protein
MRHKDPIWNVASGCYQRRYDAEGTDSWSPAAPFLLRLIDGARVGRGAFLRVGAEIRDFAGVVQW